MNIYDVSNAQLTDSNDNHLIQQVLKGNTASFSELYNRYNNQIFAYILSMTSYHIQNTEDICSEIWIKAYDKLPLYNQKKKFFTWLYTIARNTMFDNLRKQTRSPHLVTFDESSIPQNLHIDDTDYTQNQLGHVLNKLSPSDKEILVLRYIQEYQPSEISKLIHISTSSVSARISRAKSRAQSIISQL